MGMKVELQIAIAEVNGRSVTFDVSGQRRHRRHLQVPPPALRGRRGQDRAAARGQGAEGRAGVPSDADDAAGTRRVPTYCYQCVAGPDLADREGAGRRGHRGEPNSAPPRAPRRRQGLRQGLGLIQKTYNPKRVLTPMKRSNPKKGRDEDPGFVPIGWDEAFDLIAAQLNRLRAEGLTDESGLPAPGRQLRRRRHAAVLHGHPARLPGRLGPVDMGFGSGQASSATTRAPVMASCGTAPSSSRPTRPAATTHQLRQQYRGPRAAWSASAPCRCARARHEARAGRAAPVGDGRLLGASGCRSPKTDAAFSTR